MSIVYKSKELKDKLNSIDTSFNEGKKWDFVKKNAKKIKDNVAKTLKVTEKDKAARDKKEADRIKKQKENRASSGPGGIARMIKRVNESKENKVSNMSRLIEAGIFGKHIPGTKVTTKEIGKAKPKSNKLANLINIKDFQLAKKLEPMSKEEKKEAKNIIKDKKIDRRGE